MLKAKGPHNTRALFLSRSQMEADVLENIAEVAQLLAAGRCRLGIEIENLSVLDPVIGEPRDPSLFVEINPDDTLVGNLVWHEGCGALCLLRDVIEGVAAHGRHRGRGTKHDQNLFLCGADGNLLECAFGQHIAALQRLTHPAAGRKGQRAYERYRQMKAPHGTTHRSQPHSVPLKSCAAESVDVTRRAAAPERIRCNSPCFAAARGRTLFLACMARSWRRRDCPAFIANMRCRTR